MPLRKLQYSSQFPTAHARPCRDSHDSPQSALSSGGSVVSGSLTPPASPTDTLPSAEAPVRVALSPAELTNAVLARTVAERNTEKPLILSSGATPSVFLDFCDRYLSPGNYRFTLFHCQSTLIVNPIPKGPHDRAENYFADLLHDMESANVISQSERQSLRRSTRDIHLPRSHSKDLPPGHLGDASVKVPDLAFERKKGAAFPYLVIEVGFSQAYDNPMTGGLVQDTQNWLEQTKGKVKCVVLVCITENKVNHNAYGEEDDEEMDSVSDAESTDSTDSSVTHYKAQFERFQSSPSLVSSYAGTLTAFIEVWRYNSNAKKMVLAQPRVELLPNISEARITFARTDLGFEMREEGAGPNEYEMDLQDLREDLSGEARQLLAYDRYLRRAKRRRAVKT